MYDHLFTTMWLIWAAYWLLLSTRVKATAQREPFARRLSHVLPLVCAAALLWVPATPWAALNAPLMPWSPALFWTGALAALTGLLFAVWARVHIGANWSGIVTIKQGHELVTSGPYAWVRHPIYTGLSMAFVGSALSRDEWRGVVAVVLVVGSFWFKLRFEERWMRQQFGSAYEVYSARVRALVPFVL